MAAAVVVAAQWVVANWAAVAAVAAAGYSAYKASHVNKPTQGDAKRDYKTTLKQATAPVRRVYGTSAGGCILTFVEEQETTAEAQKMVVCVVTAGHEINKLKTIWFGDKVAYSDHLETSPELIKVSGRGRGVYTRFKTRTSDSITIDDYNLWRRNLKYGVANRIFMGKVGDKWVKLDIVKAEDVWTNQRYGGFVGTKITSSKPIPANVTAVKVGDNVYKFEEGNNPRTPNQVPQILRNTTQWESNMYGYNLHYVAFELTYDRGVFPNGIPQFKFEREGAKLYDPRKDSTVGGNGQHRLGSISTYEYSNNAALVILDFLSTVYGYTKEDLDLDAFISAANSCDQMVNGEKRFTINGEFDYDESFLDVLGSMLQACAGSITQSGGKVGLRVGVYQGVADTTITDKDITSDISINAETSYQDKINTYEILYSDPNQQYEDVDAPSVTSQTLINQDGRKLATSLDLSKWVTSVNQAQRIGWINLRKSRDYKAIQLSTNLSKIGAIAGKKVAFNLDAHSISGEFKSQEWEFDNENGITLTLVKDDLSYYEEDFTYHKPVRGLTNNAVRAIPTVKNLSFTSPTDSNSQGVISWDEEEGYSYRVSIYKPDNPNQDEIVVSTVDTTEPIYQLNGLLPDDYKVRVGCVNSIGQEGQEVALGFTALPPPVQSHTWLAYADDDQGNGISISPLNKSYVGISANHVSATPDITDPSIYTWALFKGADGTSITIKGNATASVILAKTGNAVGDLWISLSTGTMPDGKPIKVGDGLVWTSANQWENIGAIRGEAGKDGLSYKPFFIVSASKPAQPTGLDLPPQGWSADPPPTNQGQTTYLAYTYVSNISSSKGNGIWSQPAIFSVHARDGVKGVDGNDGVDGKTIFTEFWFSSTGVGNPTSNAAAWSSHQRANDKFVISRVVTNGSGGAWSQATKIAGTDGKNGTNGSNGHNGIDGKSFETRFRASQGKPSLTTADTNNPSPSGWIITPPTVTYPVRVWAITATKHSNGSLDTKWSSPVLWNGDKGERGATGAKGDTGAKGATGAKGSDGTTWAYKDDWNGSNPSNSNLDSWFSSIAKRTRKDGDVFVLRHLVNGQVTATKSYLHKGNWIPYTKFFDGNVLVDGTLTGREFNAQGTIVAGSGSTTAGLNGNDTSGNSANRNWRMWAGSPTAANAPFRVSKDGTLYASKGVFQGEVSAERVTGVTGQAAYIYKDLNAAPLWRVKYNSYKSTRALRLIVKRENFDRRAIVTFNMTNCQVAGLIHGTTRWDALAERMCSSYTVTNAPQSATYSHRFTRFIPESGGVTGHDGYHAAGDGKAYIRWVGFDKFNKIGYAEVYGTLSWEIDIPASTSTAPLTIPLSIRCEAPTNYWGGQSNDAQSYFEVRIIDATADANVFILKNDADLHLTGA